MGPECRLSLSRSHRTRCNRRGVRPLSRACPSAANPQSLTIAFSSVAHTITHLFTAAYFVIVLAVEKDWGLPYADLIKLWTLGALLMGLGALPAGWLADRWSAGGMMVVFYLGIGACFTLCGFAPRRRCSARGLAGVGLFASIYHPVGIAWLVRHARARGKALGINGVFGSAGVAAAGLVSGALIDLAGWRAAFFVPGAIAIVLGLALAVCLKIGVVGDRPIRRDDGPSASRGQMVREFVVLVVAMIGGGLIYQATQTALPKFFEERMGALVGDGTFGIGAMVAIVYGISGLVQVLGGHFADRYPLKTVYLLAYLLQVPLLALASGIAGAPLLLVAVLMTTMNAASFPAEKNLLLTQFSPERHRSLAFGIRYVIAFGLAPVALLLVSAIDAASGGFAWLFLLLAALAGLVVAAGLMLPDPRARAPASRPKAQRWRSRAWAVPGPRYFRAVAASAWSRSAMRSSASRCPTDRRTTSGPAPAATRCSSVSWRCVVEAGCRIRLRVSPILARCENSSHALDQP